MGDQKSIEVEPLDLGFEGHKQAASLDELKRAGGCDAAAADAGFEVLHPRGEHGYFRRTGPDKSERGVRHPEYMGQKKREDLKEAQKQRSKR